ncbi:MAG: M15 family metallopeptidase [Actinomycetota bacterium]|nr:M15 family metallopeptidase [Actinomycetota bacterium]
MPTTADYAPCKIPLVTVRAFDKSFPVHAGIAEDVAWIDRQWRARGGHAAYRVDSIWFYNCRKTTSGRSWSQHAYGWAGDINPARNPYSKRLITDMPRWWIDLWKARGFGWGGDWSSVKDAMHFSKAPREGGNGRLFVPGGGPPPAPAPPSPAPGGDFVNELGVWKKGMSGIRVGIIQGMLNAAAERHGWWDVRLKIDDDFGGHTHNVMLMYQDRVGLKPDGIVGPTTWRALLFLPR